MGIEEQMPRRAPPFCWESVCGSGGPCAKVWRNGSPTLEVRFGVFYKWRASQYWESQKQIRRLLWKGPQERFFAERGLGQDCANQNGSTNRRSQSLALPFHGNGFAGGMRRQPR